jgi:hypothetical protein
VCRMDLFLPCRTLELVQRNSDYDDPHNIRGFSFLSV